MAVGLRRTHAVIDLEALRSNIDAIIRHVENRPVMAVVKSNGYGHGMVPIARAALEAGARSLGVATSDEGLNLRETEGFADVPILVMGPTLPDEGEAMQRADLAFSVGSLELLKQHLQLAKRLGKPAKIHLQIETGIGRDGVRHESNEEIELLAGAPENLEAIWTHFAVSDVLEEEPAVYTSIQTERLVDYAARAREAGLNMILHAANSGGVLRHPDTWLDMVRPGMMIYGVDPAGTLEPPVPLQPVMHLKSTLAVIRTMEPGDPISYGRTWVCPDRRRIATVPIGYGDGYPRHLSNQFDVLVRGRRIPVRGRVCMDQIMVDLSDLPEAREGDEVVLWGTQDGGRIFLEEAADVAGTIPYELTCKVTGRVPRVYRGAK